MTPSPPPPPPPPAELADPSTWPEFLIFFVHCHFSFRYPELEALLTLQGLTLRDATGGRSLLELPEPEQGGPMLHLRLPSVAHAVYLSTRGILVKGVYQVWGHAQGHATVATSYDALVASVARYDGASKRAILTDPQCSWCINVEAFGKKLSMREQETKRGAFAQVLPFAGPVNVQRPQEKFLVLEEYALELSDLATASPRQLFFLRALAGSEKNRGRGGARDLVDQQTLKKRAYIGPTAMESEMALLMSNMALVTSGDMVIDPFVGTGSVLVPCATHGALCFGTDIDMRVLLGTGVGVSGAGAPTKAATAPTNAATTPTPTPTTASTEARVNVVSNFRQYGLPLPELLRADNSRSPLADARHAGRFDAVVCDPPYGIRAGARRSGRRPSKQAKINANNTNTNDDDAEADTNTNANANANATKPARTTAYFAPTQPYAAEDVMRDLLAFAARVLRDGGRLVYLLPTTYEYTDADLPRHPELQLLANSEQKLTKKYARRLITMVKRPATDMSLASLASTAAGASTTVDATDGPAPGDVSFANLREKILAENRKRKSQVIIEE